MTKNSVLNVRLLDEIYNRYGYELKVAKEEVRVYVLRQSMYFGAEIVPLQDGVNIDNYKETYSRLDYATIIRRYQNEEEAEDTLFHGFFSTEIATRRNQKKYEDFVESRSKFLGDKIGYEYISSPYSISDGKMISSKSHLIEDILKLLSENGPHLIILEAAAGFGKTCTAYELLNEINKQYTNKCTFFTELTRNRQAKIFKYVLLAEMDSEFPSIVKTELVTHHITTGRIPLIIDGFDELLSRDSIKDEVQQDKFQQVETMLTTIGELLQNNSKIILTSRKTAIFTGEEFHNWVSSFNTRFNVIRFIIEEPRLKDWLEEEKINVIEEKKVPIKHIANPVLLSYLRNLGNEEFKQIIQDTQSIVDKYFIAILEREQERQQLLIDPEQQLSILKKLARLFTELNITAETRDFIKDLIIDYNPNKLQEIRRKYPPPKPTIEELANTLTNHALLDRRGILGNIGFINDFIFGILIGQCLIEGTFRKIQPADFPQQILELAVHSFKFHSPNERIALWKILKENGFKVSNQFKLIADISLNTFVSNGFVDEAFDDLKFEDILFDENSSFMRCVFVDCYFTGCTFDLNIFEETSFVNCVFCGCEVKSEVDKDYSKSIFTWGCDDYDQGFLKKFDVHSVQRSTEFGVNYDFLFLAKFFKVDGKSTKTRQLSTLIQEFSELGVSSVLKIIDGLRRKGLINTDGNILNITNPGIDYFHERT